MGRRGAGKQSGENCPYALVPGTRWIDEKNIELDRSTRKADLVYNVIVDGIPAIMNTELQTDIKTNLVLRLLQYHALIADKLRFSPNGRRDTRTNNQ